MLRAQRLRLARSFIFYIAVRYIKHTTADTSPHQPRLSLPFRSVSPEGPEQETQQGEFTELFT